VFHAQAGLLPLHLAAANSSSVAVVQALAAYPEAASATTNVRRPSPLAAWMRGPERSSEVIICNQVQSGVIIRNQRALSGTQRHSEGNQRPLGGPQRPSAGPQRPSEVIVSNRMDLLAGSTYRRPDAEVLPWITPAAARETFVRRISHATRSGQRCPVAKRSTGRGRGRAAGGGGGAAVRLRTFAIARAPPASTLSLTSAPPTSSLILAAVFHAQDGRLPLHCAAANSSSVAVVQALLAAYPEAASARDNVRRPSPLAAWMRGPERSSEVIICNQGQSVVITRNQRALSGTQRALSGTQSHSVATRWAPQRPSAGPSEAIRGTQWLIRGDQRYSEALRGHQRPLRATQRHSVAFSGTLRRSEGPRHAVFTAPRPA
jgi:hypothetical protein